MVSVLMIPFYVAISIQAKIESQNGNSEPELRVLVESFLRESDDAIRVRLAQEIETAAKGDASVLERALQDARPEQSDLARQGRMVIPHLPAWTAESQQQVHYRRPPHDPAGRKHPLLLILSADDTEARIILREFEVDVGNAIVVAMGPCIGASLREGEAWAELAQAVQREAVRMFAVDAERVYLIADQSCANGAWMLLLAAADIFAGAVINGGHPDLPDPAQSYPLFLENLRHTHVLVREELPTPAPEATPSMDPDVSVGSVQLRALGAWAHRERIPLRVVGVHAGEPSDAWRNECRALLARTKPERVSSVRHWFGGPAAGSAWWLRALRLEGAPWTAEQLSILPGAEGNRDAAVIAFFHERLAFLSGTLESNTTTIEARRCSRIEIRLTRETIEWSRPVTVVVNGIKRYAEIVTPSIKTMLTEAHDGHLSHPIRALMVFDVHADSPRRKTPSLKTDLEKAP